MSLIKCRECEKEVSSSAMKCPHCGAPLAERSAAAAALIGTIVVMGILFWILCHLVDLSRPVLDALF